MNINLNNINCDSFIVKNNTLQIGGYRLMEVYNRLIKSDY